MVKRILFVLFLSALGYFLSAGCGSMPEVPDIDRVRQVPAGDPTVNLPADSIQPREGPIGTVVTVSGRGIIFPQGLVTVVFPGIGRSEFDLEAPTQKLQIRVPYGALSGPFGFTIAARSRFLENSLPSSDVYTSYRIEDPGFRVVTPTVPPTGVPQREQNNKPPNG